jgi:group II intron reverse transcriptase/maturase
MPDIVGLEKHKPTSLGGIAKRALACKEHRFQDLYRMLDANLLLACWEDLNKGAVGGVDGVTAADYEVDLIRNIVNLAERVKTKNYRAKLVRRCYIPKANGDKRPLGIPALEDKLLQLACSKILSAIYEQDFLPVSYAYRTGRSAMEAVQDLGFNLQFGQFGYIVEADIKGFFNHLDHDWLIRMLTQRVDDKAFLNLIRKWLKAGILDIDGAILHPEEGSPQGGLCKALHNDPYA